MSTRFSIVFVIAALIGLGGCTSKPTAQPAAQSDFQPRAYTLGISDRVLVTSDTVPEFESLGLVVDGDGQISLPLIGRAFAAGRTPAQLSAEIRETLQRFYTSPTLAVEVTEYASRQWFAEAGPVRVALPYTGADHPVDALHVVQTRHANATFRVYRPNEQGELELIDLQNRPLEPGDVVRVSSDEVAMRGSY